MSNLQCNVCGGYLIYHRIDDGEEKVKIISEEETQLLYSKSNGSSRVYCEKFPSHKLSPDVIVRASTVGEESGY